MEALRRIADLAKALRLDSVAAAAYIFRGLAHQKKGDCDQAIAEYDKALDLALAYNNRGFTYHLAGCLVAVLVAVLPLLVLASAYNNPGIVYLAGCLVAVLVLFLSSGLALAYNNRGFAYHLAGCLLAVLVTVLSLLGLALAWGPRSLVVAGPLLGFLVAVLPLLGLTCIFRFRGLAVAYYSRGSTHVAQGDYDQAIDDYTEALRLKPKDAVAYKVRGDAYEKQRNYDKAIADYTKAIGLDPKYVAAYNNRGFAYDNRGDEGDYCQAIADYTKAIEFDPENAVAYNNRGFAYWKQENYCQAIKDFTKTIQLKPDHATSYLNRGGLYQDVASVKFDKALQVFAAGSDVEYEGAFDQVHQSKDAEDQAIEDYDNTVRLCPNYKTDFADGKFVNGGQAAVDEAIRLLDRRIKAAVDEVGICISGGAAVYDKEVKDRMIATCHPESATFFYYLGVRSLFENSPVNPWKYFVQAMVLNYDDGDNGKKLARHLKNLNNDTKRVAECDSNISVLSGVLGIDEERLRSILEAV